jgi:uncharacterized protein YjbI with pentapeptide repeats
VAQEPRTAQERALELLRATLATSRWLPTTANTQFERLVWAIRGAIVLGLVILIASAVDKTLWDWLKLLVVPFVLALGGYLFTRSENLRRDRNAEDQRNRDLEIADQRTKEDRWLAHERTETDRQIAEQRRQDDTLQAYLDQMGQLFLDRAPHEEGASDNVRTLVRARTLTVLKVLDAEHNRSVLQFLIESELLGVSDFKRADLEGADLRGANLIRLDLSKANFKAANLSEAKLWEADLENADLSDANLNNAELPRANLRIAKLENADLSHANLSDTVLVSAKLRKANLRHANLSGADLEAAELEEADLSHADLQPAFIGGEPEDWSKESWERSISGTEIPYANTANPFLKTELAHAKLGGASLKDADLRYANLYDTDLHNADLTRAKLQGATSRDRFVDPEEYALRSRRHFAGKPPPREHRSLFLERLENPYPLLQGATMPNGQRYEDWLKDKEVRGGEGANSGSP